MANPIRFDERDSGRKGHAVVYKAAVGETATIYGGTRVTGWERWKGKILRASLGQVGGTGGGSSTPPARLRPRLFENDRLGTLARYPSRGSGYGGVRPLSRTAMRIPAAWRRYDFDDADVVAWCGPNWFAERRRVTAVDRSTRTLSVEPFSPRGGRPNERMFIEGVLELLDAPGQWCLKRTEGWLYYWPRTQPIQRQVIVLTRTPCVFDVRGSSMARPVRNIRFEDLTFVGSSMGRSGLIHVENAERVTAHSCRILGAGFTGVHLKHCARNCTVYGCWIEGAGFAGVALTGYAPGAGPFRSAEDSYVNKQHRISNNLICDCGRLILHGRGIECFQSGDNEISHNRILRMPRYGIACGGLRYGAMPKRLYGRKVTSRNHYDFLHTRNNVIRFNDISTACRDSHDFGAIEAWGPGRDNVWEYNAIHDIDPAVGWDKWAHVLFPDDAADYHTLRGNVIYECKGGRMTGAVMMKAIGQVFENNIVADCAIDRVVTLEPWIEPARGAVIRRNIFSRAGARLYSTNRKTARAVRHIDHNLIHPPHRDSRRCRKRGWDMHSLQTDPMFERRKADYDTDHHDFRLRRGSPARKLGFRPIPLERIGLKSDFPFDRCLIGRRDAAEKIQAEDYDRIRGLRTQGATCVYAARSGGWAKYENVDFGRGRLRRCLVRLTAPRGSRLSFRLEAPQGPVLGHLLVRKAGWQERRITIQPLRGIHTLYLVFEPKGKPTRTRVDWFEFQEARRPRRPAAGDAP